MNIKLTIEYDGTNFKGWQVQPRHQRTVQGELQKALKIIFKSDIKVIGSGRTDTGVHALGQVASFTAETKKPLKEIKNALNANLPDDIAITKVQKATKDFHAQYSAKRKTYRYTILNRESRSAIQRNFSLLYPYPLNLAVMKQEAKSLLGKKDFKSFQAADAARKRAEKDNDTIRTISKINIRKKGDFIEIDIEANGFLYKMVRNIVGTLLEIGSGKLKKGSMKSILAQKSRIHAGCTAKPHGLSLLKVNYLS